LKNDEDPHLWMNINYWAQLSDQLTNELGQIYPELKDSISTQNASYQEKLSALDKAAQAGFASIPDNHRVLITAHDAFGYLGKNYDLEVKAIQGISTESEAGLKKINDLKDYIVEKKIPVIFAETTIQDRSIKALLAGAKSRGAAVEIGGKLYSDSLGQNETATYLGMMSTNFKTIVEGLGGTYTTPDFSKDE
jgi:manganese/zinc/iron transport system substrate-binding protein